MKTFIPLATDLMGTKIKTPENEEVGVVQNIMIDPQNGTVIFVVLCYANFMGKVHRQLAIPRQMLKVKHGNRTSTFLEIDKHKLLNTQTIESDDQLVSISNMDQKHIYELLQSDESSFSRVIT